MRTLLSIGVVFISAALLAVGTPASAAVHGGVRAATAPHGGHFEGHRGFDGHRGFEGHRGFHGHGRVFIGPSFVWGPLPYVDYPPAYTYAAPSAWYYCPAYGAYYPDVQSCPQPWVTVPAE